MNKQNIFKLIKYIGIITGFKETSGERIACHSLRTTAEWIVIDNTAIGFDSTRAGTWVSTFVLVACSILWTFRIDDTFWLAIRRDTHEGLLARAYGLAVYSTA